MFLDTGYGRLIETKPALTLQLRQQFDSIKEKHIAGDEEARFTQEVEGGEE